MKEEEYAAQKKKDRRSIVATRMLGSLLANPKVYEALVQADAECDILVPGAIKLADLLIAELEK